MDNTGHGDPRQIGKQGERQTMSSSHTFTATSEAGTEYTIRVRIPRVSIPGRGGPLATRAGRPELHTSDGRSVNRLEKGVYQVVTTGVVLRSSSPDAP